jgi:hypothetical protein
VLTATNDAPATFPHGTTTVTWTVVDTSGNTTTDTQLVTVRDHEPPTITCPANLADVHTDLGQCYTSKASVNLGVPSATNDNCGLLTVTNDAPAQFPKGTTTVHWTAVDTSGNTSVCNQQVTVNDHEAPSITCPSALTDVHTDLGQCYASKANVSLGVPSATNDNCGLLTVTNDAPAQFPKGTTTVHWTAVDTSGNTTVCNQLVTVNDLEAPTITCPSNLSTNTGPGRTTCDQVLSWAAAATDNCTPSGTIGFNYYLNYGQPGQTEISSPRAFSVGTTTVTAKATDAAGNSSTCPFTVTVADTTPPVVNCPANVSTNTGLGRTTCDQAAVWAAATATDNCTAPGSIIIKYYINYGTGSQAEVHNGDTFPVGTTTVTAKAADAAGNCGTCTFTVTVTDTTPPLVSCPPNVSTNTGAGRTTCDQVARWAATATDNCTAPTSIAIKYYLNYGLAGQMEITSPYTFPVGTTTVTVQATDAAGNQSTCTFTVTVVDDTKPVISGCPGNITVRSSTGNPSTCSQVANWTTPSASDNCGVTSFTSTAGPGSSFPLGTNTVTYTARDAAGNTAYCSFTVTVIDDTPPVVNCPANIVTNTGPAGVTCGQAISWAATATDNCSAPGAIVIKYYVYYGTLSQAEITSPIIFPVGTTTVTVKATDAAGNYATCNFIVTVNDMAPSMSCSPASQTNFYGCTITTVAISAVDGDSAGSTLAASNYYTFNGGAPIAGLPPGLSVTGPVTTANGATWQVSGNASGGPGSYVISFPVKDQCGTAGSASFTNVIAPAPAVPSGADWFYTGPTFYWTSGSGSSSATLTLMATLKNKFCSGDIRNATVSFAVRDSNNPLTLTPIKGAQNLPVGLVNPGDTSVGTAAANVQYSIGSATAATLQIAVIVNGNYQANDPQTDTMITIAVPVPGGQIVGGGTIDNSASAGYLKGATLDSLGNPVATCFSFYVQYNKSGSNPQGGVQLFDRSFYKPDGTLDTRLHTYMFKSTAISVLSVTLGTPSKAQFTSKANLIEINPDGTETSIEGNDVMQLTLTDNGSTLKTLGITVQRTKGGSWFSSSWNGTMTTEKQISSGNLSIR